MLGYLTVVLMVLIEAGYVVGDCPAKLPCTCSKEHKTVCTCIQFSRYSFVFFNQLQTLCIYLICFFKFSLKTKFWGDGDSFVLIHNYIFANSYICSGSDINSCNMPMLSGSS